MHSEKKGRASAILEKNSAPLLSGSGIEPNDDCASYAMRQNWMQPHGGQPMMTTQVTTKAPAGFDGKT